MDLKRKPDKASLQRILDENSVLNEKGAEWLIRFWRGKTVAGLLQIPVTLHHTMHLKEAMHIKEKILKCNISNDLKKFYKPKYLLTN